MILNEYLAGKIAQLQIAESPIIVAPNQPDFGIGALTLFQDNALARKS